MQPATSTHIAASISLLLGIYAFYLYYRPYFALGIVMGTALGIVTFTLLRFRWIQNIRRQMLVIFAILTWAGLFAILSFVGLDNLAVWVDSHLKVYYFEGLPRYGTTLIPCSRALPELMLGLAVFGEFYSLGAVVNLPSNIRMGILVIIPFLVTAFLFGRGFCGWICFFGGTEQGFMCGKKLRWKLSRLQKSSNPWGGGPNLDGLREDVKDIKYGIAVAILLLALGFAVPLVCIVCWVFLVQYVWLGIAALLIFALFVVVLPFMTKRRWWCLICPVGAMINFIEGITPFRVKLDKEKCSKCYACVKECETYAMTRQSVEASGKPNIDCIKCARCIEVCPEECIDIYVRGTEIPARSWFIPLAVATAASWYGWFIITAFQILPELIQL